MLDLTTYPPYLILCLEFLVCGTCVLLSKRLFGLYGLYIYGAAGVITANIVVLKTALFPFYDRPMALGTVIFSSLFLCSDLINEYYGKRWATKSIWLGFFSYFLVTLFVWVNLAYTSPTGDSGHQALSTLFMPAPAIFLASLIAYFAGQYTDVFLYHLIHKKTGEGFLWLRSAVSTFLAMLVDNALFSVLAWHVLSFAPLPLEDIFWTYVWGVSLLRFLLTFGNIGFMYLSKILHKQEPKNVHALS